jgi:succinoglycan biosynthesis transport protein ExoP
MAEPVEVFRYIRYLRLRWRWIGVSAVVAVSLAAGVSLLMPRQYTATARVVIEPPAGTDLRAAMAVSPIYLESLKTYEQFASGDSLFQTAAEKFGLIATFGGQPLESIKKRVLRVGIVRNTRILEVAATLPDPRKAQALAQYLAESTVELTRSVVKESDRDLLAGIERQEQEARAHVQEADEAWSKTLSAEPMTQLQAEMEAGAELLSHQQSELATIELAIADQTDREKHPQSAGDLEEIRREAGNSRARQAELQKQIQRIGQQQAERERTLSARVSHRDRLEAERKARQTELAAAETRLREARADVGYRGERMRVIDPGVVPQRPSSPNVLLNVLAALLLGIAFSVLYLAIEMNYQEQRITGRRSFKAFVNSADE